MSEFRNVSLIALLTLLVVGLASCGDDDNPTNSSPVEQMSAKWWLVSAELSLKNAYGIWGTDPDNVYLAVENYVIRCHNGRWRTIFEYPENLGEHPRMFRDIWGYSEDSCVVVGSNGLVMFYRGGFVDTVVLDPNTTLRAVYGSAGDNIYVYGNDLTNDFTSRGILYHYDGTGWRDVSFKDTLSVDGIWVSPGGIPFVLLPSTGVWSMRDTGWYNFQAIPGVWLGGSGITGRGEDELFVGGLYDTIWHYRDSAWVEEVAINKIVGLRCNVDESVLGFCYSGDAVVKTSEQWVGIPADESFVPYFGVYDGWASSINDVWIGAGRGQLLRYDGADWLNGWGEAIATHTLFDVFALDRSNIFIAGSNGKVIRKTPGRWIVDDLGTTAAISAVWGRGPSDVYAVSAGGVVYRFDGSTWSAQYSVQGVKFNDVVGTSSNEIWAVGYHELENWAMVAHWDGIGWTQLFDTLLMHPSCACETDDGEIYIFSDNGYLWRSADGWQFVANSPAIHSACEMDDMIWGVGDTSVYSFDGVTWTAHYTYEDATLGPKAVWASPEQHLFVAGGRPRILEYDGEVWSQVRKVDFAYLTSIYGISATDIWAVGELGVILRYSE